MNKEFFKALDLLERQKGIPKEYMKEKVEAALQAAVRKETGSTNIKVVLDEVKMDVKVYQQLTVIDIADEERKAQEEYERREAEKAALAAELAAEEAEAEEAEEEEEEPEDEDDGFVFNKALSKKTEVVTGIYWCSVTAIYLFISFYSGLWDRTWIVWPVAGVSYAVVLAVAELVIKRKGN